MKRLFFTLIFLFFIYFSLEALFYFLGPGHNTSYLINDFQVKEEYVNKQKNENQSYNFVISKDNSEFYLQIFQDYDNQKQIIKEIKSYEGTGISCIMPIFIDNKALTDLICLKDGIVYNYSYLKNLTFNDKEKIDEFYNSLSDYISKENLESQDVQGTITLYKSNMQANYYFSLATYKGFVYANPTNKVLRLENIYTNDIYDNYLSAYVDKYFVTVNYDEQYGYTKIYIYDITSGKKEEIKLAKNIEKNSYIQGIVRNTLYLFDISNKIQYEVDVDAKTVLEVGNVSTGVKIYKNGSFERISAHECASNKIKFEESKESFNGYEFLKSTFGVKTGYTYYYKKSGDYYQIYRVNNINKEQYTYLFDTKDVEKILALNNYIYFLEDGYIKYYSDHTGVRTLAYNSELNFNQNIKYQIIYQK